MFLQPSCNLMHELMYSHLRLGEERKTPQTIHEVRVVQHLRDSYNPHAM